MNFLSQAIYSLRPDSEYTYTDNDYSTINWIKLDGEAPTQQEIDAEIDRLKMAFENDKIAKEAAKLELLAKLGITEDEVKLLLS